MTQTELKEYIRETVNDDLKANLIIGAVDAYSSSSNDGKPLVSGSLPPDYVVEQWWAGDEVGSAHFWQKAPYRTNGDVIEDIKAALKHFMGGNDC